MCIRDRLRGLCAAITKHPETMRDYRTRLKEQNIDVEGYLGLGAAEPTVARFSGRLRRLGRSWSSRGALAMAHAIAGQGQGRLRRAVPVSYTHLIIILKNRRLLLWRRSA